MTSPKELIESQLPSYFLEQYPQFAKFIEEYYNFLDSSILICKEKKSYNVGDTIYGSLSKAKAVVKLIADDKIYFEYETEDNNFYKNEIILIGNGSLNIIKNVYKNIYSFVRDVEQNTAYDTVQNIFKKYFKRNVSLDHSIFSRLDPSTLTKKILDYYKNRGTENSYYWFFRIFFDEVIDLYYPKVDILKLSDVNHIERRWIQIEYFPGIVSFERTRIFSPTTKATATVRKVNVKVRNNETRSFLDLIYINGSFVPGDEIIGYDIISGREVVRGNILSSVVGLNVEDGGIGHKKGDEFTFHDGIGIVTHLEEYSITNIKIKDPGHFYSVGDYITFENEYTGATATANAYVESIIPNYTLSGYSNLLNDILKYRLVDPYNANTLPDYIDSANTFSDINLLYSFNNPSHLVGSIDKIRIEKSGLNYKFSPKTRVINPDTQGERLFLYEVYLDQDSPFLSSLVEDSLVIINDEPAVFAGLKTITEGHHFLSEIDLLSEDAVVAQFYASGVLRGRLEDAKVYLLPSDGSIDVLKILTNSYSKVGLSYIDVVDFHEVKSLKETAVLESILGDGVSKIKITDPGLMVEPENKICFLDGPFKRPVSNNIIHPLDTTLSYKNGILFDPIEEYKENNSDLSSQKHMQDNYYYQSFSYEITTKIPAELIEPLLLDELHPAGFIAFIRNKIEEEVSNHIKIEEFHRIEMESDTVTFNTEIKPWLTQMQEYYVTLDGDILNEQPEIEIESFGDDLIDVTVEGELENTPLIDVFEGFRLYVEDCLIRPDIQAFSEFTKDKNIFFDRTNTVFFDNTEKSGNAVFFDNDGTEKSTGYGSTHEYSRLEKEALHYEGVVAIDSFLKIISVEDEANWKTNPINRYKGTIASLADYQITNHKATVQDIIHIATNRNVGGRIVVRDWMGLTSKYRFDNIFIWWDEDETLDITKNFSGEFYNYTLNPVWYFDNTDANNLIYDFSSTNIQKILTIDSGPPPSPIYCYTPHHVHNSLNFSNQPETAYKPCVSGNTLANKGSYLPTTEILTKNRGYIQIKDVTFHDEVAYVEDDGTVTWRKPDNIIHQKYNGIMYNITDYNRMSITLTPDQDLVVYDERNLPHFIKARKVKSKRLNLPRADKESFGLVDVNLVGGLHNAIFDYIPIDERIHKNSFHYEGDVYCLIFNEYREYVPMEVDVNNVDLDLLQLSIEIGNDYTLPKIKPTDIHYTNHHSFKNYLTVDIEHNDTVLYLPTSNSIVFDFNTNKEEDTYISFVSEAGLINATKILNHDGPLFDHFDPSMTFDNTKGYGFDNTAQRFQVHPILTYFAMNHVLTKVPKGMEQRIQYTTETKYDYVEFANDYINVDNENNATEIIKYEELKIEPVEIKYTPKQKLIIERDSLLYPKLFCESITFDIQNLSPPNCISGHFDYIGANNAIYKFSNDLGPLSWDMEKDPCNFIAPQGRRGLYNTFDTGYRTFDQTEDCIVRTEQYVEPEQILTNSDDGQIVEDKQNYAGFSNYFPESEQVLIGENLGQVVVATIKNYRIDVKKKFFDSLIWTFDRNYTWEFLNPAEHSGFDSAYEPDELDLECVHLFFDNDGIPFDRTTITFTDLYDSPLKTFSETFIGYDTDQITFDRFGAIYKDCSKNILPFPYDDENLNISLHLILHDHISGYGPYNHSKCFDSNISNHGFDKTNYPFFDNNMGCEKPHVLPEVVLINIDHVTELGLTSNGGRNDPLQTLILSVDNKANGIRGTNTDQVLINHNDIFICVRDFIYYEDKIDDFYYSIIRPYLTEQGCDPSSTKGTNAEPDYILINAPEEEMHTTISENEYTLYHDSLFIDSTSSISEIHNELNITYDILSCDPIRYTDIIYGHRRDKIHPYIYDTCPGDDRILQTETDSEVIVINANDYNYFSNTFSYPEVEIYSHVGNHTWPNAGHTLANNKITTADENSAIHVVHYHHHIGKRNCLISLNETVAPYFDTIIEECHLEQVMREYIKDTIPLVTTDEEGILIFGSNSVFDFSINYEKHVYIPELFVDGSSILTESTEIDQGIDVVDRNPYIWLGQTIGSKVDEFITNKMIPKPIQSYVFDKIPSVTVKELTKILHPRHIHSNTNFDVFGFMSFTPFENHLDATSEIHSAPTIVHKFDLLDRHPLVNVNRKFTNRLDEIITDLMTAKPIVEYDGDHIPIPKAFSFVEEEVYIKNWANSYMGSDQIIETACQFVDATFDNSENPEIEHHVFVADRNLLVNINRPFSPRYDERIIDKLLDKPIVDYDGDHIPSVTVDSRPSIKYFRAHHHDLQSNTFQDFNITLDEMHLDSTFNFAEFNEIEYDKNLYSDWKFIPIDREVPARYFYDDAYRKSDFTIRENRYDTTRSARIEEQHEIEENTYIGRNPLYPEVDVEYNGLTLSHDTIIKDPDALYIDASTISEEFDEFEFDTEICDIYSIIPLTEKIGTIWQGRNILDRMMSFNIEDGRGCIQIVTVDSRPSIETERFEYHDLPSNTFQTFTFTLPEQYLDATFAHIGTSDELEKELKIPDRHKYIDLTDRINLYYLDTQIDKDGYIDKILTEYDKHAIPTVTVDTLPSIEIQKTEYHDLKSNTIQEFSYTFASIFIDSTIEQNINYEFEQHYDIGRREDYFDLSKFIKPYNTIEQYSGKLYDHLIDHIIEENMLDKILAENTKDKNNFGIVSENPEFERLYVESAYGKPVVNSGRYLPMEEYNFVNSDLIINDGKTSFIDSGIIEKGFQTIDINPIIWHTDRAFTLANLITKDFLFDKIEETDKPKILIDDFSIHSMVTLEVIPHMERIYPEYAYGPHVPNERTRTETHKKQIVEIEEIISNTDFEKYIESTFNIDEGSLDKVIHDIFVSGVTPWYRMSLDSTSPYITFDSEETPFFDNEEIRSKDTHNVEATLINRPHEYANTALKGNKTFIDTIITADHFEKFIDSSAKDQEIFYHLNLKQNINFSTNANSIFVEQTLINRPHEYANTALKGNKTFINTIITGDHFEKFIDSGIKDQQLEFNFETNLTANGVPANNVQLDYITLTESLLVDYSTEYENSFTNSYNRKYSNNPKKSIYTNLVRTFTNTADTSVCYTKSEVYKYNKINVSNVIFQELTDLVFFDSNLANDGTSTSNEFFSTNSTGLFRYHLHNTFYHGTNTVGPFFSWAGPGYRMDLQPTLVNKAFWANTYPIPSANLDYQVNRNIDLAIFEKYSFVINDIANTHNGFYFAVGTTSWEDDDREDKVLFGKANGVVYELDGEEYTNFNDYKNDFNKKSNARITVSTTLDLAKLLNFDANTVNGANSDSCHDNYDPVKANTYSIYYWSNATNDVYSAGGEIRFYELNNVDECLNYSINKVSYLEEIREEVEYEEFTCA